MQIITNNFQKNQFFSPTVVGGGGGGSLEDFGEGVHHTSWYLGGTEVGGRVSRRQQSIKRVRLELTSYLLPKRGG